MKKCLACQEFKDKSEFYKHKRMKDGLSNWCKSCHKEKYNEKADRNREYARNYMAAHKNERSAYSKEWVKKNPEAQRIRHRRNSLKRYGLTIEQYEEMYQSQNGLCAICGSFREILSVDHNHQTLVIRELLCNECNRAIGFFHDDIQHLKSAIAYLERHE